MFLLNSFARDQSGATAIQYAMIAGVVTVAVLVGSLALRGSIIDLYENVGDQANQALVSDSGN